MEGWRCHDHDLFGVTVELRTIPIASLTLFLLWALLGARVAMCAGVFLTCWLDRCRIRGTRLARSKPLYYPSSYR
jgi:hypothetical protein